MLSAIILNTAGVLIGIGLTIYSGKNMMRSIREDQKRKQSKY